MSSISRKPFMIKTAIAAVFLSAGMIASIPIANSQGIGLRKLDQLIVPSEARVLRGKKVYKDNCVQCHGETGAGNPFSETLDPRPVNLSQASQFKFGGGTIQIFNLLSKGKPTHAAFKHLAYQDQWALSHFVRSLGPTKVQDPEAVVLQAKFEAENGVCDENLKSGISEKVKPKGAEQMERGKKVFAEQGCAGCHGNTGEGVTEDARKFSNPDEVWVNGSSELGIFKSLANGVNAGMASYVHVPEDDRWALVHYVRSFVPAAKRQTSTEEQVTAVCRALSVPAKPESITVEQAMRFMVADANTTSSFGVAELTKGANKEHGKQTYQAFCQDCHGVEGVGVPALGPFGAFPPFLFLDVKRMTPASAGGDYVSFAKRSSIGPHATLAEMTPTSHLSQKDWQSLQMYIAQDFKGDGSWVFQDAPAVLDYSSQLETGFELKAASDGIEANLLNFVSDSAVLVDKDKWFDFDRLNFNTGSATLDMAKSKSQLINIFEIFKAFPQVKAKLGGYTDSTGDPEKNLTLSQRRAENVLAQLVKMGVDKSRLQAEGYGAAHPVCPANDTPACRRQNRRISLRVTEK